MVDEIDTVKKVVKPRKKNGKAFKAWDSAKERSTYDGEFYDKHQRYYQRALPGIVSFVKESLTDVCSVVDVGCGNGDMLSGLNETHKILGVDFSVGAKEKLAIPSDCYVDHDLTVKFANKQEKFDLVMSLEVWEHIPEEFENQYLHNLLAFDPKYVIVSCAEPGQWGRHHYSCQGRDYVLEKFTSLGFEFKDDLTEKWNKIKYLASFYRKNTLIFQKK